MPRSRCIPYWTLISEQGGFQCPIPRPQLHWLFSHGFGGRAVVKCLQSLDRPRRSWDCILTLNQRGFNSRSSLNARLEAGEYILCHSAFSNRSASDTQLGRQR